MSAIDEIGNNYGRLTVLNRVENKDKKAIWNCICECGNKKLVSGTHLRTGHVVSCGCYHSEVVAMIGRNNKGKSDRRGKPKKYLNYNGILGKVIGVTNRSEQNGAVQYLVQCAKCGCTHTRNAKHLKQGQESQECSKYKPPNWSGLEREDNIIRKQYGITMDEFNKLLELQGGGCAICGKPVSSLRRRMNIDHCHETNKVRGILCSGCNTGLGHLGDNIEGLKRAMDYLLNPPINALAR